MPRACYRSTGSPHEHAHQHAGGPGNLQFGPEVQELLITLIILIALFAHMCQGQGLHWIAWMGWLESRGLDLCAMGKAWMTRAGDHGRKGARAGDHGRKGCLSLSHGREGWLGLSHGREGWPGLNNGKKRYSVRLEKQISKKVSELLHFLF